MSSGKVEQGKKRRVAWNPWRNLRPELRILTVDDQEKGAHFDVLANPLFRRIFSYGESPQAQRGGYLTGVRTALHDSMGWMATQLLEPKMTAGQRRIARTCAESRDDYEVVPLVLRPTHRLQSSRGASSLSCRVVFVSKAAAPVPSSAGTKAI